jgi:hypothetical protein
MRGDGQDIRNASAATTAQQQRLASNTGKPASPSATGAKPQLTASTLADNTAANSKKAQNDQTTHKAWYHWVW